MRAVYYSKSNVVKVDTVPDPKILNPRDAIVEVTTAAICGSDLHLVDGWMPTMNHGDILGHEFMGNVVEVGPEVKNLKVGDRVVVPFAISCGKCFYCTHELWSLCDNGNPNGWIGATMYGYPVLGAFGYAHITGGYAGGQAEYVRVPFADVGPLKLPTGVEDEKLLFLGDILPTGYMAAENCNIQPGDTVAVWGCGPVGQFAIKSAYMLGAEKVIAIDQFAERLAMASQYGGAETLNFTVDTDVVEELKARTGGRGPDACIDAVGMEAHGTGVDAFYDRAKQIVRMESDRPTALRDVIQACRPGGTVSVPGVYGGFVDKFPIGAIFNKGLTLKAGQTHVHRYMKPLLDRILNGEIDPSGIITHPLSLEDAPHGYHIFKQHEDGCIKVILKPRERSNGHNGNGSNGRGDRSGDGQQ
jgi:threonine dehydrogenase-like Zn-dependent dehydrogenase